MTNNYSSFFYEDCYLIYLDKLGTSYNINENDSVYRNRIGFFNMVPLYEESVNVLNETLGEENYILCGFSDSILAVVPSKNNDIGRAASKILVRLLSYNIPVRVYITHGNIGLHYFQNSLNVKKSCICPIYGSALLEAHKIDSLGIKALGVYVHGKVKEEFDTIKEVSVENNDTIGFLNLNSYLDFDYYKKLQDIIYEALNIQTVEELEKQVLEGCCSKTIKNLMELLKKNSGSEEQQLIILREGFAREKKNKEVLLPYVDNLEKALNMKKIIIPVS